MQGESVTESPRLVDCVVRGNNGETLFEEYKGDRMFTYSYLTNNAGDKVTSVYCGYPSDCSLVHKRIYGTCEDQKIGCDAEAATGESRNEAAQAEG